MAALDQMNIETIKEIIEKEILAKLNLTVKKSTDMYGGSSSIMVSLEYNDVTLCMEWVDL